jgi:pyridoxamine 5'-phosphate oxidase
VLFYNYRIHLQLLIRGIIKVHTNDELWQDHCMKIEGKSINDYNTKYPPGKKINNPLDVKRTKDIHFALLELIPESIEYLKLRDEPNRVRALFTKENDEWNKTFLIP